MTLKVNIDTNAERASISPYIYGSNFDFESNEGTIPAVATASRLGGNRFTGYNWENNASNAGSDWKHSSDNYLTTNLSTDKQNIPGVVVTNFQEECLTNGTSYSLVTLQMAGYAAKDKNGTVSEAEAAPSARWTEVKPKKESTFSDTPDVDDDYVYMDEFVNFLVGKYKDASTTTGIKGYSLDNEPGLWSSTHPRIHANKTQCTELISKSIELSKAVKDVDSYAEIFGPALYGMGAYQSLQSAPDWDSVKGSYSWFVDYYLAQMKTASNNDGRRLLDVLDFHYYPEAKGSGIRITEQTDYTNTDCNKARIQAPRTLWDSTYTEDSWIGQYCKSYLPLLPKMQQSINDYYPGTKIGVTEYNFGGNGHISGGIAQADVFGILGKEGVYLAAFWPFSGKNDYVQAAFNLYRNYDGNKSTYGDIKVKTDTSDSENSSVYASVFNNDDSKLNIIMINKNYDQSMTVSFNVNGNKNYTSGRVWGFDKDSANITERTAITNISGNQFLYEIPALTVCHIVLTDVSTVSAEVTAPTEGQSFEYPSKASPITIFAEASTTSGTISKVTFYANGTQIGESTASPYSITWYPTGYAQSATGIDSYAITASAINSNGTSAVSAPVNIKIKLPIRPEPVGNLTLEAYNGSTAATTNSISPKIKITNSGENEVNLSTVTVRYYYTIDTEKGQSFWCDSAAITSGTYRNLTSTVTGSFVKMSTAKSGADYYLEIGFTAAAGSLAAGETVELQLRLAKNDWSNYTQSNDYSFNSSASTYTDTSKILLYISGQLNIGSEP